MLENIKQQEIILNIIKETDRVCSMETLDDESLAFFRDNIRKNIFVLQEDLMETYSKTIIKFIILPLIAYIDEQVLFKYRDQNSDFIWNLLQMEMYDKNDSGEYVFEIIDHLLSDNIYPQICYEVIFFILDGGFVGKYYERTHDHDFISYNKKITKIIQNNSKDSELDFYDVSKEMQSNNNLNVRRRYWPTIIKILVPVVLFGISILIFTI